jgi:SAM-dependent methyltransferase
MSYVPTEPRPEVPDADVRAKLTAFYRTNAAYAGQQATHDDAYFGRLLAVARAVLPDERLRVLELGAASGGALRALRRVRPRIESVAVDLSWASLQRAVRSGGAAPGAVVGDALELPFRDASVDAAMAFEVIEHLPDVERALREVLRVLRRPGYVILGVPNHASLWTPLADLARGSRRLAFGVDGGRGACRWWRRNAALSLSKRLSRGAQFLYRSPVLDAGRSGDWDAVYYACPLDLLRFFQARGATLVTTFTRLQLRGLGRFVPVELQGSAVLAWRID